jgi:hypothetical protein
MNLRCRCAGNTIVNCIIMAMKLHGGQTQTSPRSGSQSTCGTQHRSSLTTVRTGLRHRLHRKPDECAASASRSS